MLSRHLKRNDQFNTFMPSPGKRKHSTQRCHSSEVSSVVVSAYDEELLTRTVMKRCLVILPLKHNTIQKRSNKGLRSPLQITVTSESWVNKQLHYRTCQHLQSQQRKQQRIYSFQQHLENQVNSALVWLWYWYFGSSCDPGCKRDLYFCGLTWVSWWGKLMQWLKGQKRKWSIRQRFSAAQPCSPFPCLSEGWEN